MNHRERASGGGDWGEHPRPERMVAVASCASRVDAQLKRGALASDGIRALVVTDDAGGAHPELAALSCGAVRVVVPDHQVDLARDLLQELDAGLHALPSTGDHERIDRPRPGGGRAFVWLAGALLGLLVAYQLVTVALTG